MQYARFVLAQARRWAGRSRPGRSQVAEVATAQYPTPARNGP
jgi:hypothetical protein